VLAGVAGIVDRTPTGNATLDRVLAGVAGIVDRTPTGNGTLDRVLAGMAGIVDRTPTGNATLDRVLAGMAGKPQLTTVRDWIEEIYFRRDDLEGEALGSLIAQGILRHEKTKRLWIIDVERFPMVNNRPQRYVKSRLAQAILTDDIPDSRDIILVAIAEQCGLLGYVLSDTQLSARRQRIQTLCNLETISRKVSDAIAGFDATRQRSAGKIV
jgi:hypothetical protein